MNLTSWRKSKNLTLAEVAARLGIDDANPARTLQRFETGERRPSATLIARIEDITRSEVCAQDMHETRLQWERQSAAPTVSS